MRVLTTNPTIKDPTDARWYLAIAQELEPELPIDREVQRLAGLGYLPPSDEVQKIVRRAVYGALVRALDGPASEKNRRENRKKTPEFWHALKTRADKMLEIYDDIEASLEGKNIHVALSFIEEALAERMPASKRDAALQAFKDAVADFHNAAFALFHFQYMVEIATAVVTPKRGRPAQSMYYFVRVLGHEWFKLTGKVPTRQFNAIEGTESGPFYSFCSAAAQTVEALLPPASLESAVRKVTDEWKHRPSSAQD